MPHFVGEEGVDFSWARPGTDLLATSGKRFVMRYLSWGARPGQPTYPNGKILKKTEALPYLARDIAVGLNWEFDARDQLQGTAAGTADATEAVLQAKALGAPDGLVIYFSADWDVADGELPRVKAYWSAAAKVVQSAGYRFGVYGGLRVVSAALDLGYHAWQTYAWSGGKWDSRAHIRQYLNGQNLPGTTGGDYDMCRLMRLDAGLWGLNSPPTVTPTGEYKPTDLPSPLVDTRTIYANATETRASYAQIIQAANLICEVHGITPIKVGTFISGSMQSLEYQGAPSQTFMRVTDTWREKATPFSYHMDGRAVDIAALRGTTGDLLMWDFAVAVMHYVNYFIEVIHTTPYNTDDGFYGKYGHKVSGSYYGDGVMVDHLDHTHLAASYTAMVKLIGGLKAVLAARANAPVLGGMVL